MDSVGQRLAANSIATFNASSEFETTLHRLTAVYPGVEWVDPWPQSNHSTFAMRGIPGIAFSSTGRVDLAHWPDDDLRWLNPVRLADVVRLITNILSRLSDMPSINTRLGQ